MLTRTEVERLAAMAHALRPDWPIRSLCTWLMNDHAGRAYADVAVALAVVATDPATQKPKRMNEAGPWWNATVAAGSPNTPSAIPRPTDPRCTEPGHEHELARNCRACRSEALARDDNQPAEHVATALTAEQAERNAMWARTCRAALNADRTTTTTTTEEKP